MAVLKKFKLSDFIEINPKVALGRGAKHSFVEMKDLNESQKYVLPSQMRELKGGARFQDGDTLFARITPCLENGKICQVKGLRGGVGYGSTEFLVFRGKENISSTDFIYYLSRYDVVRRFAEQNMVGTSGRQRVSKEAFENISLLLPDLPTQTAIAEILSSLDDKIELNNQINQELEALAQTLFKHWFIDFEFPNEEGKPYKSSGGEMVESELGEIPKGWLVDRIESIVDLIIDYRGKTPKKLGTDWAANSEGIKALSAKNVKARKLFDMSNVNYGSQELYSVWMKDELNEGDVLLTSEAPLGEVAILLERHKYILSQRLFALRANERINPYYLFEYLASEIGRNEMERRSSGSTVVGIKQSELRDITLIVPSKSMLNKFEIATKDIYYSIENSQIESERLSELRDMILPKLISGELEVTRALTENVI